MPVIFLGSPLDEHKKQRLEKALDIFESMLKGRTWAAINSFTIADLTLTVTVAQIEMIDFDLEPYTRVRTWLKRCKDFLSQHGYDVSSFYFYFLQLENSRTETISSPSPGYSRRWN